MVAAGHWLCLLLCGAHRCSADTATDRWVVCVTCKARVDAIELVVRAGMDSLFQPYGGN
jgi:hypothetical protein